MKKGSDLTPEGLDPAWVSNHVQQHRYGLQIVKCVNSDCCEPFETSWLTVFPQQFIPPPAIYQFRKRGLKFWSHLCTLKIQKDSNLQA